MKKKFFKIIFFHGRGWSKSTLKSVYVDVFNPRGGLPGVVRVLQRLQLPPPPQRLPPITISRLSCMRQQPPHRPPHIITHPMRHYPQHINMLPPQQSLQANSNSRTAATVPKGRMLCARCLRLCCVTAGNTRKTESECVFRFGWCSARERQTTR